jgi:hypothetical protein
MEDSVRRQPLEEEEELIQPKQQPVPLTLQTQRLPENGLQRQTEAEEEEQLLQTAANGSGTTEMPTELEAAIQGQRSGGQRLTDDDRTFFEPRLRADLSNVRLHTDALATETAEAIKARAFTLGRHVFFGAGQYPSGTEAGQRLLAHELTHVLQQGAVERPEPRSI